MIGYYVPHSVFPAGYHCDPKQPLPYAGLASQKGHMSLYLMGLYIGDGADTSDLVRWFREAWTSTGRKLDMGKACVRFKKIEDVPLAVVGEAIRRLPAKIYIARYLAVLGAPRDASVRPSKPAAGKTGEPKKTAPKTAPNRVTKTAAKTAKSSAPVRKKALAKRARPSR